MSHPFGDLLSRHLHHRHGLSQARLAEGILQDPSIIGKMGKGERLSGPRARERVVAIVNWLYAHAALETVAEANALLAAAGMAPLRENDALEWALLRQLRLQPTTIPALTRTTARTTNLSAPLTSFVGRTQEVVEVVQAVTDRRLVTLTGVGGVGKTRLAIEAGMQLAWGDKTSVFTGGVWFAELAALSGVPLSVAQVAQAIGNLFKLSAQVDRPNLELLQEYLADKQLLLILDNCEHLVDACAEIADGLLRYCWQLHILTTSREELRIPGETVYAVPPLAAPDPGSHTLAQVLTIPAAQLLVERMGMAPSLRNVQEDDAVAIAHICRRLDGIPLALELAAPLTRSMTFAEIAARLDDQMAILTNSYRTVIPRHQTMHGALVWSYRLLTPAEQKLLARLSVFVGGWTPAAGQAVCADEPEETLLMLLHQLIAKSFVLLEYHDSERRYRLLEPVRQFAQVQLVARGEQETTCRRHAVYFLSLAEQMAQARDTPHEREWLQKLEPERDNLRAVNGWAIEHNEAEFAQRFNGSLFAFWIYRTSLAEASDWLEAALALKRVASATGQTTAALYAEASALDTAGYAAALLPDHERAQARFEREVVLYSELGDRRGIATALRGCGFAAMMRHEFAAARQCYERALALSRTAEDSRGRAWAIFGLGNLALIDGDLTAAQTLLQEALPQLLELGITFGAFRALLALGHVARARCETQQACRFYRDALHLQQPMHYLQYLADGLEGLAGIAVQDGDVVRAVRLWAAAFTQRAAIAMPRWRHQQAGYERDVALAQSRLDPDAWSAAWAEGCAMTLEQAVDYALVE